uniref:Uncharacterized protein n=1 Tax=Ascaris lumbricoides TaxID=6252 RepID=A0A0M3IGZ9_ASCLU
MVLIERALSNAVIPRHLKPLHPPQLPDSKNRHKRAFDLFVTFRKQPKSSFMVFMGHLFAKDEQAHFTDVDNDEIGHGTIGDANAHRILVQYQP